MKDIYSPSFTTPDDGDLSHQPIPMPDTSVPDAPADDIPELNFDIPMLDDTDRVDALNPDFLGSYREAVKSADPDAVPEFDTLPKYDEETEFKPVLNFSGADSNEHEAAATPFVMPEEDLSIPEMPVPVTDPSRVTKKSLSYETTVKIKNARHANKNEKTINEPIKKNARPNYVPKQREFNGIASGTAHVSGGLPELRDDQMYVAVTAKELRRLKSRKFRGLGVFSALCLAIIAAFCIWSYANSFADPLIGRWNGNISSIALGIDALQQYNQDSMSSTWEFNSSGSMYINLVLNNTPVSLSGSFVRLTDPKGEPYLKMTLKNPTDNTDYTVNMYYTVTGTILQFNDMEGAGIEIDLTKE